MSDSLIELATQTNVLTEADAKLIETTSTETVTVTDKEVQVVEVSNPDTILLEVNTINIVSEGIQGPPGMPGTAEDEVPYSKRIDFVTDSVLYKGEAQPGSAESAQVWRIRRITFSNDGDSLEEWAAGTAAFDKAWTNRASFTYI